MPEIPRLTIRYKRLLILLLTGVCQAMASLHVLDLNGESGADSPARFFNPADSLIAFKVGPGLQVEPSRRNQHLLQLKGWDRTNKNLGAIIRGDDYLEFTCKLSAGVRQITGVDLYVAREGKYGPEHLSIAASPGHFPPSGPTRQHIRGDTELGPNSRSPQIRSTKDFRPVAVSEGSHLVSFRIYPSQISTQSSITTVLFDSIVIYGSAEPLETAPAAVPDTPEPPTTRLSLLQPIDPATQSAKPPKLLKAIVKPTKPSKPKSLLKPIVEPTKPAKPPKLLKAIVEPTKPAKPKSLLQPIAEPKQPKSLLQLIVEPKQPSKPVQTSGQSQTIVLDLGREVIDQLIEPIGTVEGPARLVATDMGDGIQYQQVDFNKLKANNERLQYALKRVGYTSWSKLPDSERSATLADSIRTESYFEFAFEFEPSVRVIDHVIIHASRNDGKAAPNKLSLFPRTDGNAAPEYTPKGANGSPAVFTTNKSQIMSIPDLSPIRLGKSRIVTFRFYAWGWREKKPTNSSLMLIDKIELQVH